jgi:site-specific recombinase XerD
MSEIIPSSSPTPFSSPDGVMAALYTFINGKTVNTRRSYKKAIQGFIDFIGGNQENLMKVEPIMVIAYKQQLQKEHSTATVANRLAALSAMYTYLIRLSLTDKNPITLIDRDDLKVNAYERAKKIAPEQFREILAVVPTDTLIGKRDRAIFLMICLSGLRRSSILNLKGNDIEIRGLKVYFKTALKGGKFSSKELPFPVWEAIQDYLKADKREVAGNMPIFMPTRNSGDYLLKFHSREKTSSGLSQETLNQSFKRYAHKAGVMNVSLHSIRHLGASLYYEASGNDLLKTMNFLNHQNISTTQIYINSLKGEENEHWQEMMDQILS